MDVIEKRKQKLVFKVNFKFVTNNVMENHLDLYMNDEHNW